MQAVPTAISPSDLGQDLRNTISSKINKSDLTDKNIGLYATALNELGVGRLSGQYVFEGQVLDPATVYQIANLMVGRYRDIKNNDPCKDLFKNKLAEAIRKSEEVRGQRPVAEYICDIVESQFQGVAKVNLLQEPE